MDNDLLFSHENLDLGEQDHDLLALFEEELEVDEDTITEVDISGSEESYQYAQLVAAELDSGAQLQMLNESVNALIIIVFVSVIVKIIFRIVDNIF